ncbi:hypothetical protein B0J18DRAFT_422639 [Chaetomium sp. MPI-SDFR-AT-0129]|nr:hypothetical protein B0J18DRAFT_422639 [Chaetomium sp. MPI-SDFR-AT-0129]
MRLSFTLRHLGKMAPTAAPRQSRWGPRSTFTAPALAGLNLAIKAPMTAEQVEAYALHVRISEITQKLETDDIVPANSIRRLTSPTPEYDMSGRRTNTRHQRYRESLTAERQSLITQAAQVMSNYHPPAGFRYTTPPRITEKLYIPVKDFPEVNFIGQILGPRGRSLTETATASGATIVLRGKGSVKEGCGRKLHGSDDMNEPLHCLITADSRAKVENAKSLLTETIEMAIITPEHANTRKQEQLRALARVNGTFRDDEGLHLHSGFPGTVDGEERCSIMVVCRVCGGNGHIARDCVERQTGRLLHGGSAMRSKTPPWRRARQHGAQPGTHGNIDSLDVMYSSFLSEVCPRQ